MSIINHLKSKSKLSERDGCICTFDSTDQGLVSWWALIFCIHLLQVWNPPSGRPYAWPAERPLGWGWCSLWYRPGDGRDQRRLPRWKILGKNISVGLITATYLSIYLIIILDELCVIITPLFHLHLEQARVVLIFRRAMLSGQQSCFLSNQACSPRHMVLFMTEGDKCGPGEPSNINEANAEPFACGLSDHRSCVQTSVAHRDWLDTGHWSQRHREFCSTRRPELDNCWHARPGGVEVQTGWFLSYLWE